MKTPDQLHRLFSQSEYGKTLEGKTRWSNFHPEGISNELWESLLGDDANNLRHMPHTRNLADAFSIYEGVDEHDFVTLSVAGITHDWGEAIITDIAYPEKTGTDEVNEQVAYRHIAEDLLGKSEGEELSDVVWSLLDDRESRLGNMFCAIENVGYYLTASRAGFVGRAITQKIVRLPELDNKHQVNLASNLLGMEHMVHVRHYPDLSKFAEKYSAIGKIVLANGSDIDGMDVPFILGEETEQ